MPAVASITIVVDDKGAVQAMNNVTGATEKMTPAFEKAGSKGNMVFTQMTKQQERARDAAALFARTLGVEVPRQLEKVIANSRVMGPAVSSAFNVAVIVGFAVAIAAALDKLLGFSESLQKIIEQAKQVEASAIEVSNAFRGPQTIEEIRGQINANGRAIEELNRKIGFTGEAFNDSLLRGTRWARSDNFKYMIEQVDHLKEAQQSLATQESQHINQARQDELTMMHLRNQAVGSRLEGIARINFEEKAALAEVERAEELKHKTSEMADAERTDIKAKGARARIENERAEFDATMELQNQARLSGLAGIAAISVAEGQAIDKKTILYSRGLLSWKQYQLQITAIQKKADDDRMELTRQREEETTQMEMDAAIASLPPWQRANAQIVADADRRIREIQALEAKDKNFDGARQVAAVWKKTFAEMRDSLASELEGLFDDITSGNIGQTFLRMFKKLIFQMVAAWILGMRQMQGASQGAMGGGGGILGGLFGMLGLGGLGGLFGGGGGNSAPMASAGDLQSMGMLSSLGGFSGVGGLSGGQSGGGFSAGLPMSAGGGAGAAGLLPAGGLLSAAAGKGSLLANMGGVGGLIGLAGMLGGSIAGSSNRALGGLGGMLMGGALGAGLGALFGGMMVFAGPIGALLGLIGGIFGIFGGGKKRKQRRQLEDDLTRAVKQIQDAYDYHQVDYSSAMDQLEQLRQQYAAAQQKVGGDVNQRVNRHVNDTESHIRTIEAERQRRGALVFGPAQFRHGGYVGAGLAAGPGGMAAFRASAGGPLMHFAGGGEVPAVLHAGEFVMRPEAVRSLGVGNLQRMNAGGGGGGGQINLTIQTLDAHSFGEWLRKGGMKTLVNEIRRAQDEGAI